MNREIIDGMIRHFKVQIEIIKDNLENYNNSDYFKIPMPVSVQKKQRLKIEKYQNYVRELNNEIIKGE